MRGPGNVIAAVAIAFFAGALLNLIIAESIGWSGAPNMSGRKAVHFVEVEKQAIESQQREGPGWRLVEWVVEWPDEAAIHQYMQDKGLDRFEGRLNTDHPRYEPAEVLPPWSSAWRSEDRLTSAFTRVPRMTNSSIIDVALGWPFLSFVMSADPTSGMALHGAYTGSTTHPGMRVVAWRPIFPGVLLNTLLYSAAVGSLCLVTGRLIRTYRRQRWRCPSCGYDRRGIAATSPCPECGKFDKTVSTQP